MGKKCPICTSGEHFSLITKYQQGGKVMYAPVSTTRSTCNHKPVAKIPQPDCWGHCGDEGREVSCGWTHEQKPVVPVQQHLMNQVPHPAGVGRSRCPLGPLRTHRVCTISVSQLRQITWLMMRSCCIPHNRVLVREQERVGNYLRLLLLT